MVELIKNLTEDVLFQSGLALCFGFMSVAFFGELLTKSEWIRDVLIGKEGGEN